ncbi:MAG: hypothetical protein FD165_843 [Gammaproteobacteria bacterium]|nr:MAG: hypothetical protein FD165_843 [Gammaproteobacteria bacterium]TND06448.1 MAG: hypothetical protein FD120_935 [Gammaproteobacteria bacterium]
MQQNHPKKRLYRANDIIHSILGIAVVISLAVFIASLVP